MPWRHRALGLACLVCMVLFGASDASAQWYYDGVGWYGGPSGSNVGDCPGNCGAGCSGFNNPCGGPRQYWLGVILDKYVRDEGFYVEEVCEGDSFPRRYNTWWWEYDGLVEWRYWGYIKTGCIAHDGICGALYDPRCVWFKGCGNYVGRGPFTYQAWIWGVKYYREATGWGDSASC